MELARIDQYGDLGDLSPTGRSNVECGWEWVTMTYDTQRPGQPVIALEP